MNASVQTLDNQRLPIGALVIVDGRVARIRGRTFGTERYDVQFEDRTIAFDLPRGVINTSLGLKP